MKCPLCESKCRVIDSRMENNGLRRRRECKECLTRFTTYENIINHSMDKHLQDKVKDSEEHKTPTIWEEWKEIAEVHGVDRKLFHERIWGYEPVWSYEKAATTPKRRGGRPRNSGRITEQDYQKAEEVGLTRHCLFNRVYRERMTVKQALSLPKYYR